MIKDKTGGNPFTSGIADFVAGLRYDSIPDEVRERIKLLILDSLGCAIFGSDLEWSRILMETLGRVDSSTGSSRLGHRAAALRAPCRARQRHAGAELRA